MVHRSHRFASVVQVLAGVGLAFFAALVQAVPVAGLYETSVPVDGRSDKSRDAAFADAMAQVAIRISGRRDAAQKLSAVLPQARKYVQRYGYPVAGTLQVGFDSDSLDQALSAAGLPLWGRERPATLVYLAIEDANTGRQWVTGAGGSTADVVNRAAADRGIPLIWPAMDRDEQAKLDALLARGANAAETTAIAGRYRANAVLLGRLRRDTGAVRWQLFYSDSAAEASGSLEEGVHLAADTYAANFAVASGNLTAVQLDISGLSDLDAYAQTLNHLEGMTLVRAVAVEQVNGDTIQFRVSVRGDAATLRRSLQLDNRFTLNPEASSSTGAAPRLSLRYQP